MSRDIKWDFDAWKDYLSWQNQDKNTLKRINELIKDTTRDPFDGIGKPEALKGNLSGFYSRRINSEHRLVYAVDETTIYIIACKGHYN
ncbi:Txe/YoeB family addiction module toxin [Campylobacter concisus]|jgi:addiction module toxin, txe/yoeB family|uniref:Putative mRNA interferase YoeB n=1 Tax=Campylobacter concisus TaxID=199 RepID=A0A1Y5MPP1_9BACT|nr:Txe/YoeB family addiction module toxin [Campylobacter concisus]MCA6130358.1 Txe/YoeB family addiction module toxin [Campylobacter concisus]MCA6132691.1 Txe/YoeB family addiction module toxin [Campylobacter concisus]OUT07665.1 Txe/YoeB family addiction module toxin [Campylobacter concisus]